MYLEGAQSARARVSAGAAAGTLVPLCGTHDRLSSCWQGSSCSSSLPSDTWLFQSSPGSPKVCLPTAFQQLSNSGPSPRYNLARSDNRNREEQKKKFETAVPESWQTELRTVAADD